MIATAFGRYHYGGCVNGDLSLLAAFLAKIVTPLVIDMDGDGVELVSLADSTAFFDLNIDGYAELTGWVNPDDALLALDVDGDGIIDDNSELFGNQTGFANGFLALAAHDANADGVIDANDAVYADLIVWQDLDGDGFSDAGEMMGLADAGIVSISLNSTSTDFTNQGHWVSDVSTVTWGDGTNTSIEDVHFENDTRASVALLPDDFQYHVDAFKLPVLFGYGQIASTWVVLSQDATLRADAEALLDLLAVGNVSGFMTAFEDYLLAWADVDHIDPDSRNTNIHGTQTGMDARHLTFLEKAYGQGYIQKWWDGPGGYSDPHHLAARQLTAQFEDLVEMLAGRFIAQSATSTALMAATTQTEFDTLFNAHLFSELTGLVAGYSPSNRGLEGDLQPVLDSLVGSIQSGEVAPEEAARLFYIMHHDMEPDATLFSDQLRNLADINGAAEAYMLSEGVRALADGHQLAFGTSGDDILSTNDYGLIVGGKGNDTLSGGAEADLYIYTSGDGSDVIEDAERFHSRTDRLVFTDLTLDQVTFGQNSSRDLVITLPDNETVTIAGHFAYGLTGGTGYEMELIEFAYGTVLDTHQIRQKSVADQKVTGAVSGTRLSENYIHTQGDGSYTITDLGINSFHDSLTFTDVNAEDAKFSKTAHMDLRIELPNGEIITVVDHFRNGLSGLNYAYEIEKIVFADGTELNTQDIRLKSIADQKASGDVLGTEVAETYSHSQGDGSYTITDFSSQTSQIDRLEFTDVDAADVLFSKNSDKDLIITLANGETITVIDHFLANHTGRFSYQIEQVTFSDGTVLDLQRIADKVDADLFAGGGTSGGQDQTGTPGADNYAHVLGDGSYTITDESSSPSTIDRLTFLDVTATDVAFSQNAGGDLVITLSNGETVTITDHFASTHYDMEEIAFADGTVYTPDDILNLI
ncbi:MULTISPECIES: calcium-binding protein [unclassified Roseobacter]|uniref:calcium-binding protein n=1 Tax=unclassified Roseobacter TaxID=196798 RepID=UPI001491C166|nr:MULTISPECIES: calcium-binding protein [unclassified Roseobacter]NNY48045.1 hypothetical protein [Roseobacter sp. HKCCD8190]NNY52287.1 hypothetical protein [Roseobacter sp. HKCCD8199]NNZ07631.1 hypothetical protein [Roseobacter sp. HKCCD8435]NNZ33153.1 hypothetical protein [Roseobacter sp. HKCCD8749]